MKLPRKRKLISDKLTGKMNTEDKQGTNPSVQNVEETQENQSTNDLSKASEKLKTIVQDLESKSEDKKFVKKSKKSLLITFLLIVILLVPVPKNVGGDIEIEGTPAAQQAFLRPATSGVAEEFFVKSGDSVKVGQKIALLRNWELEEKILNTEKELARLISSISSLSAEEKVSRSEYKKSLEAYNRNKAQSDYLKRQANSLTGSLPPKLMTTKKQLEQLELQTESLVNKAALHKFLSEEEVYPKQLAVQSEYEAAASAKQAEAIASQLKAEKEDLQENSNIENFEAKEALMAANSSLYRAEAAKSESALAKSQIQSMEKLLKLYNQEKNRLLIKSPIKGVFLTLKPDSLIGQNFNKGDTVAIIGDLEKVKIKLQLPEQEIAYTEPGQDVTVRLLGVPNEVFYGKVDSIAPVTSEITEQVQTKRIFEITVLMDNLNRMLKPGMTGHATIYTNKWRPILFQAWDEVYRVFRLDRFIDRNPFYSLTHSFTKNPQENI